MITVAQPRRDPVDEKTGAALLRNIDLQWPVGTAEPEFQLYALRGVLCVAGEEKGLAHIEVCDESQTILTYSVYYLC